MARPCGNITIPFEIVFYLTIFNIGIYFRFCTQSIVDEQYYVFQVYGKVIVIHTHVYILCQIRFPFRLLQGKDFYSRTYMGINRKIQLKEVFRIWSLYTVLIRCCCK